MRGGTEAVEDGILPADENGGLAQCTGKVEVVGCDADPTRGCDVGGAVHTAPRESEGAGVSGGLAGIILLATRTIWKITKAISRKPIAAVKNAP